ncbi:MAG TPA: hypothetical protein VFV07_10055 [Rhizomicrobium sp.]|nr:hypothetical protein [Rhizomicrobium sp.]
MSWPDWLAPGLLASAVLALPRRPPAVPPMLPLPLLASEGLTRSEIVGSPVGQSLPSGQAGPP